jgi:hypothetical protein
VVAPVAILFESVRTSDGTRSDCREGMVVQLECSVIREQSGNQTKSE